MVSESITVDVRDFKQLLHDVALMKEILTARYTDDEGETTDWVRKELAEARQISDSELLNSEEVKQMILTK